MSKILVPDDAIYVHPTTHLASIIEQDSTIVL